MQFDLLSIRGQKIFTTCGIALRLLFEEIFDQVFSNAKDFIVEMDLSNQPYSFSYDRFVALKILLTQAASSEARIRFRREIDALAAFGTHPNVVTIRDRIAMTESKIEQMREIVADDESPRLKRLDKDRMLKNRTSAPSDTRVTGSNRGNQPRIHQRHRTIDKICR